MFERIRGLGRIVDAKNSTSTLAQDLYWEVSMAHPRSRFLQGAELALACHEQGLNPTQLQKSLLKDKQGMDEFLIKINDEHRQNGIRYITDSDLRRGIRMVFSGWAQRMMLFSLEEVRTVVSVGTGLEIHRNLINPYMEQIDDELNTRASMRSIIPRPRRRSP